MSTESSIKSSLEKVIANVKAFFKGGIFENAENRTVFVACFLLSILFWIILSLSERYDAEIQVPVAYLNLPENKVMMNKPPDTITVSVENVRGRDLLLQTSLNPKHLQLDYKRLAGEAIIPSNQLLKQLKEQLSYDNLDQNKIEPAVIKFQFEDKGVKKVPIKLVTDITTEYHFELKDNHFIQPDSIEVTGPMSYVGSLEFWRTDTVQYDDLNHSPKGSIGLKSPEGHYIQLSDQIVDYQLNVEEYTEKEVKVEIVSTNKPDTMKVFLYPQLANVKYQVGTSDYETEQNFKVVADFSTINMMKDSSVPLRLQDYPNNIRNVKINPDRVDFMIFVK